MLAKWIMVSILAANAVLCFRAVNKPRKPVEFSEAVGIAIAYALEITAIVIWWH